MKNKLAVIQLSGGLGNQLFQYAMGIGFQKRSGGRIMFDISALMSDNYRKFELKDVVPKKLITNLKSIDNSKYLIVQQTGNGYDFESIISGLLTEKVYFSGKWQSEDYFIHCMQDIKTAFQMFPWTKEMEQESERILGNTCSIHFRLTDYQKGNNKKLDFLSTPELTYFKKAVKYIQQKNETIKFVVFSDDIKLAKKMMTKIKTNHKVLYMDRFKSTDAYQEMLIMSRCQNHIISNSSYSWWAARINENDRKTIIAPKKWFSDVRFSGWDHDIVPKRWIKI